MIGCSQTKRLIDEADRPDALSFEASNHVAACVSCESFADERARLRSLLASGTRVSVPMNFDAVLKAKLEESKRRFAFGWLSSAGYLRLGAATAALIIMVVAAQQAGLFSGEQPQSAPETYVSVKEPPVPVAAEPAGGISDGRGPVITVASHYPAPQFSRGNRGPARVAGTGVPLELPGENYLHEDTGVMLVRGPNGEGEVSLPMVSVGAQSLVFASAGASRRAPHTIGTSF